MNLSSLEKVERRPYEFAGLQRNQKALVESHEPSFIILLMHHKRMGMGQPRILSFVMGKSCVTPLNDAVTVPKLGLVAATLVTRINKIVMKELERRLTIGSVTYWTDSIIVLKYIANEKRRFFTVVPKSSGRRSTGVRARSVASRKIRAQSCRLRLSRNQSLRDQETLEMKEW